MMIFFMILLFSNSKKNAKDTELKRNKGNISLLPVGCHFNIRENKKNPKTIQKKYL